MASDQIKEMSTDDLSETIVEGMNELMETDEEYISHVNALVLATDEKVEGNIGRLDQIKEEQAQNNEKLDQISADQKKINKDITELKDIL